MPSSDLRSRIRGAMLGTALGDAFGLPFEGALARDLRNTDAVARRAATDAPWSYSDDTEMMLGVAESFVARGGVEPEHVLRTLARNYEPARGYGHGTKRALELVRAGAPWRQVAFATWPDGSRGSGGAVRVVPIACAYHRALDRLDYAAQLSASVTHAHRIARVGAMLHARAIAMLLASSAPTLDAPAWLRSLVTHTGDESALRAKLDAAASMLASNASFDEAAARLGNGVTADEAVPLALFAFARCPSSFEDALVAVVGCGGDADTIGALTGALSGAWLGEEELPQNWLARLEDGARGRRFIVAMADAVCARCPHRATNLPHRQN